MIYSNTVHFPLKIHIYAKSGWYSELESESEAIMTEPKKRQGQ